MKNTRNRSAILVIAGFAPSLVNFRGPLLRAMQAAGHDVIAAAPELSHDRAADELAVAGIQCRDIPLSRTGLNLLADARLLLSLTRLMRKEAPQVVLAYTAKAVIFGLLGAAIARVPRRYALITGLGYAFTGHASGLRGLVRSISRALYRTALKRSTKVFFQNSDDAALFLELRLVPEGLPVVIVNGSGVDLDQFSPISPPTGPIRFLLIARLLSAKGIREYATAAREVRAHHPYAQFHLVGGIDTNPDCLPLAEVEEWQMSGTLVWHGEVRDVRPHIAGCHVYVLPSYREGTPRSVLEAMAMARPIITTDAPGCRETVADGKNGFLVPPRSVDALAAAMVRFISEPSLVERMGKKSRELAEAKYDVAEVNAHMLQEMELA